MRKKFEQGKWVLLMLVLLVWCVGCSDDSSTTLGVAGKNIHFVETVFPNDESWAETFKMSATDPACKGGRETLSRAHLLTAVLHFEDFCGSDSDEANKQELAAFLANASLETNGAVYPNTDGGLCFDSEVPCVYPDCSLEKQSCCDYCTGLAPPYDTYPACPYGYFGRGALQITNPVNYEEAGQALNKLDPDRFPDPEFLKKDPGKILEGDTAWIASLNFWMNHVGGLDTSQTTVKEKTTCHDAIVNYNDFGKTVEIINGNLECCRPEYDFWKKTQWRIVYYKHYTETLFTPPLEPSPHVQCTPYVPPNPTSRCGTDEADANNHCRPCCKENADCPGDYPTCYTDLEPSPGGQKCWCPVPTKRCGNGWSDADNNCRTCCNTSDDCPEGQTCFGLNAETPAGETCTCGD